MGTRTFVNHRAAAAATAAVLLSIPVLFPACTDAGDASAGWTGTIDTLASGTIVVRNGQQGIWDEAASWRALKVDLSLGQASGVGPELFGDVRDIEVDSLGRIYVLDSQAGEIRVFEANGTHLRTIARRGEGPGELQGPTGMELSLIHI